MKKAIRAIAKLIGWSTDYHVSANYAPASGSGWCTVSMAITVIPWIHVANFKDVVKHVEAAAENPVSTPVIISITKIGL